MWQTKGQSIWQRNFYEHIGRGQKSIDNIREYILNNPQRWADDPENPQHNFDARDFLFDIPF
nr:transposase [Nostoc flagelliforme]